MMKKIRVVALLLSMMLVAASCGGTSTGDKPGDEAGNTDTSNTATDGTLSLGLPEGLRFDGETFRLITAQGIMEGSNEDDADVVQQAIYRQALDTSERLGVEFKYYDATPFDIASTWVYTAVNSWSDDYDAVFTVDVNTRAMAEMGFFRPISELEYIDLDNDWWAKDYIEAVSLNPHDPLPAFWKYYI